MHGAVGLTELSIADLKKALKVVHSGDLTAPLSLPELTRCGLQHVAEQLMSALRETDTAGVRAVLVCVLSERMAVARKQSARG